MDEYRYEPGPDNQARNSVSGNPFGRKAKPENAVKASANAVSYASVFIWLAVGLLISGAIAIAIPYIFAKVTNGFTTNVESLNTTFIVLLVVSIVLMIPSEIVMAVKAVGKNSVAMKIGYFVYVIAMGLLLSSLLLSVYILTYDPSDANAILNPQFIYTVSMSFLISGGCFVIMGIIGKFTKHMNAAIPVVLTAVIGAIIISIVNIFLRVEMLYWIVDFVLFGVILLVTAIDMHNISKIIEKSKGELDGTNLSIYCAYALYVDFINIFIRVIYYVLILTSKKK